MTTTAVIYIFQCPKGRVYAGRRSVSPEALRCWPNRGHGPLPDGYVGSGKAWQAVARRHGAALVWRIVARVAGDRDAANAAERRAIRLARAVWGRKCLNVADGGDGQTREAMQRYWADPASANRNRAAIVAARGDPVVEARRLTGLAQAMKDPAVQARRRAGLAVAMADPAVQARRNLAAAEAMQRPEVKARQIAGLRAAARKRRARKALAPFAVPPSIAAPCVCLWAFLPTLRLSIAGPTAPARRR